VQPPPHRLVPQPVDETPERGDEPRSFWLFLALKVAVGTFGIVMAARIALRVG
jgi:hypothetical protein